MAYDFKKLSDVSTQDTVSENTNFIVEEEGVIKKLSNFFRHVSDKIAKVDTVDEVSDEAHVLIEEDGVIKKVAKDEVGGGVKVASTAEVGQTIVVKSVDENGKPTEWECADKVSSWDDLEDKPFYNNVEECIIVPEQTVTYANTAGYTYFSNVNSSTVQIGDKCELIFDGSHYFGTVYKGYYNEEDYDLLVDFILEDNVRLVIMNFQCLSFDPPIPDGEHTVEVKYTRETVHTLDEKFIPYSVKGGMYDAFFLYKYDLEENRAESQILYGDYDSLKAKFDAKLPIYAAALILSIVEDGTYHTTAKDFGIIQLVNNDLVFKTGNYGDWFYLLPNNEVYYEEHLD